MFNVILVLLSFTLATATYAGGDRGAGNGGDAVRCTTDGKLYALDYQLTLPKAGEDIAVAIARAKTAREILNVLQERLDHIPDLGNSLRQFVQTMNNFDDWTQSRIWRGSTNSLVDLKDEKMIRTLDITCKPRRNANGTQPQLEQVVIRLETGITQYEFNEVLMQELESAAPYQLSFLLIHEWLWGLTTNIHVIRNVNQFLHSKKFFEVSSATLKETLVGMGLDGLKSSLTKEQIQAFRAHSERLAGKLTFFKDRIRSAMTIQNNEQRRQALEIIEQELGTWMGKTDINDSLEIMALRGKVIEELNAIRN